MYQYFVFNKPYKVISQFSPDGDKKTLSDFFPDIPKNIYPVGRLDYDSEGLLLLTNDKPLTNLLLNPFFSHPRTYFVQVEGEITNLALNVLQNGVFINVDGKPYKTKKANATLLLSPPNLPPRIPPIRYRKDIPTSWVSLTLTEGKNRQVRKMTAAAGFPTLRLIRYAIGKLTINGLMPGCHNKFDEKIKELLSI